MPKSKFQKELLDIRSLCFDLTLVIRNSEFFICGIIQAKERENMTEKKGINPAVAAALGAAAGVAIGVAATNLADPKKRAKVKELAKKAKSEAIKVTKKVESEAKKLGKEVMDKVEDVEKKVK